MEMTSRKNMTRERYFLIEAMQSISRDGGINIGSTGIVGSDSSSK